MNEIEVIFNEKPSLVELATSRNKIIQGASDIDGERSKKSILACKKVIDKMIASGKYRNVEGKDKTFITSTLKNKEFWNRVLPVSLNKNGPRLTNGLKYHIFRYEGLTLLSINSPVAASLAKDVGDSRSAMFLRKLFDGRIVYAIVMKAKNNKVIFRGVTVYPKRIKMTDRTNYDF